MSSFIRHSFHLVDESPWPLIRAGRAFFLVTGFLHWFRSSNYFLLLLSVISLILVSFQWWRDVSAEGAYQGLHAEVVVWGLRWGIVLFIISEIFFFLSFFWCYFHVRLSPALELGRQWCPIGVSPLNPLDIPLLNTVILVSSGVSVTWRHHSLIGGEHSLRLYSLGVTCLLGVFFTVLQGIEYFETRFSMADRVYGSVFFIATGFHGFHVIVGTIFLFFRIFRIIRGEFSSNHHFGFEAAAWYWHFVDVVWLFLYLVIYWWGSL